MTATLATVPTTTDTTEATPSLWRTGLKSGAIAAVATTAVAGAALGVDIPLEIEGEQIPLLGFAQMTVLGAVLGVVLAKVLRRRTTFVRTAAVLTALSCVPSVAMPDDASSVVTLVVTHLVAALVVVPALAARLADR